MQDEDCLVFVEVRTRAAGSYASAAESVDARKQRKLAAAALYFLGRHPEFGNANLRFDVVAIDRGAKTATLDWIVDAFRPER